MYNLYATDFAICRLKQAAILLAAVLATLVPGTVFGQPLSITTVPPLTGTTTTTSPNGMTFNLKAKKGGVKITNFTCDFSGASGSWEVWYKTDSINGAPTITTANNWVLHESGTWSGGTGIVSLNMQTPIKIPSGKTYGFYVKNASGTCRYHPFSAGTPTTFGDANLQLYAGAGVAYVVYATGNIANRMYRGTVFYKLDNNAPNNAGVISTPMYNCPGTFDVTAVIENAGKNQVKTVKVNWSKNGVVQTPVTYSSTLDTFGGSGSTSATVTLGKHTWSKGNTLTLKIWTSLPNNVADTVNDNDTLTVILKPSISGTYTIGATGADYTSFSAAVADLEANGVCGPVTFNVRA